MSNLPGSSSPTSPSNFPTDSGAIHQEHDQVSSSPGVSIKHAAASLGVSTNTIRRWIKDGRLRTEKVAIPQGFALKVFLPETLDLPKEAYTQQVHHEVVDEDIHEQLPEELPTTVATQERAEAMATYSAKLLEPLVARLTDQEHTIRELATQNGRYEERVSYQEERIKELLEQLTARDASPESFWRRWFGWLHF
jgi:hypothetical protein